MTGFISVFCFSFFRSIRETAVFIVLLSVLLLLIISSAGTAFGFHTEQALVRDVGVSTLFLGGIFVAIVCAGFRERSVMTRLALLRPLSRAEYCLGDLAGIFLCAFIVDATIVLSGFVVLREGSGNFDIEMIGGGVFGSVLWGAYRNFRKNKSFVSNTVIALFVTSLLVFVWDLFKNFKGFSGDFISEGNVLLLQVELLCLFIMLTVFFSVWAGGVMFGRVGSIIFGWSIIILGIIKQNLAGISPVVGLPIDTLVPNIGLLWGGDFFYSDLIILPWTFVWTGCLYLVIWSCAVVFLGLGVFYCRKLEGLRVSEVR